MLIRTIWAESGDNEMPWLVAAVDEYTIEEHGKLPDFYTEKLKPEHRELLIAVPERVVRELFKPRMTDGTVKPVDSK